MYSKRNFRQRGKRKSSAFLEKKDTADRSSRVSILYHRKIKHVKRKYSKIPFLPIDKQQKLCYNLENGNDGEGSERVFKESRSW